MDDAATTFADNPAEGRYELRIGDELIATAEYAVGPRSVALTRIFTRPTHRGRGLAAEITEYAVNEVVASGRKVVPVCSYAAKWFDDHPERKEALA